MNEKLTDWQKLCSSRIVKSSSIDQLSRNGFTPTSRASDMKAPTTEEISRALENIGEALGKGLVENKFTIQDLGNFFSLMCYQDLPLKRRVAEMICRLADEYHMMHGPGVSPPSIIKLTDTE